MRFAAPLALALLAVTGCKEQVKVQPPVDAGPVCLEGESLVDGVCRFVCNRDGDCASGQRCNLFTGSCEPKPPAPDAGPAHVPCTEGAERCSADGHAVELCDAAGTWTVKQACAPPDGFCKNEMCLACQPGFKRCGAGNGSVEICKDDGSGFRTVTCGSGFSCVQNECSECSQGQKRCTGDGKNVQECRHVADESRAWAFGNAGDNFDGTCITQVCEAGTGAAAQCRPPACVPGALQCKSAAVQQTCGPTGAWVDTTCTAAMGPSAECVSGACVDECGDAVKAKSYYGCEYWTANLDNSVDAWFKGGTLSGQGTTDSQFVFVVTNQSANPATVDVFRWVGSAEVKVKSVAVPGRGDPTTHGLVKIQVPWQSVSPASAGVGTGVTGKARYGYRLVSTKPITVYQFNPVDAYSLGKACSGTVDELDCGCDELDGYPGSFSCSLLGGPDTVGYCKQVGTAKRCGYYTFSNDASLILPSHILGTSYVALTPDTSRSSGGTVYPGQLVIVGTAPNTTVTVKASAPIAAGSGIAAIAKGATQTFTLNTYDVLQLSAGVGTDLQGTSFRRTDADLTGTIITSTAPVAVFGGHPCTNVPFDKQACDHVEEQIFPFNTWGKSFVAVPMAPLRLTGGGMSGTPASHYKVVAACPVSQCPNGTTVRVSKAPASVLAPNACEAGTTLGSATAPCRLKGGAYIEFVSAEAFTIDGDQPIAVAQFFTGQQATSSSADEGDPSMVLLPPVEQWRLRYTVLASTGLRDNYLALSVDRTKVDAVMVDNLTVPLSNFTVIAGSNLGWLNYPVGTGTHTITVTPKPGISPLPGAGVTVYGYDSYVSYGYTGGLDLSTIVTGINPGG